jgi:hypothetical protein
MVRRQTRIRSRGSSTKGDSPIFARTASAEGDSPIFAPRKSGQSPVARKSGQSPVGRKSGRCPGVRALAAVVVLSLAAAGCSGGVDLEVSRTFQQAQAEFDDAKSPEDYLRAAGLYQEVLDRGVVSGAVLYNQGNAFVRAGQRGRAIAAYRRALRYRPRDPLLRANLDYVLPDSATSQRRPVIETLLFWQDWLSYPEKFYLAAAAAVATFGLALAWLVGRRRLLGYLAAAGLAVTLLLVFSAGYDWYRCDHVVRGVVVVPAAIARKGNARGYEPAFTEPLAEGDEFRLVERRGDWLLIRMPGGPEGWVDKDAVATY